MATTVIAPARSIARYSRLRLDHEGERQRQAQTDGQQLLGIERNIENLPGHIHDPEHDARDQQRLQQIGQEDGRSRGGGGELLGARQQLSSDAAEGGLAAPAVLSRFVH